MQTDFIALYRGQTVAEARLIALSADPDIVCRFAHDLLGDGPQEVGGNQHTELHLVPGGEATEK